jgi:hypothetical protein
MNAGRSTMLARASVLGLLLCLGTTSLCAQQQRKSPPGTAEFTLNEKKITVAYSRPSMRGRKIMGELVPFDKVWRTGANEATSLTTEADLEMGGLTIPKGSYTLFTIPSNGKWTLIVNKQTGQWGTEYDASKDLGRIDMKVETLKEPVEQFIIGFDQTSQGGTLKLEWENTRASVEFQEKK